METIALVNAPFAEIDAASVAWSRRYSWGVDRSEIGVDLAENLSHDFRRAVPEDFIRMSPMTRTAYRSSPMTRPMIRRPKEADIEAATRIDDMACFLASHSKAGGPRSVGARLVLFCTELPVDGKAFGLIGGPCRMLLEDLRTSPLLSRVDWADAAEHPPPDNDAINIEAMTASPEGGLWIGLRSPVHGGKAIFAHIGNPRDLPHGGRARIDRVEFVDLGGLGARGLTNHGGRYLIAAGPASKGKTELLYRWEPGSSPVKLEA